MPAIWAAGAAVGGDILSGIGQSQTNKANMAMQQQSEQWQEMMSDTAMQRRVVDLKAAGLNPLLATTQGGASSGIPVMPTMQNPMAAAGQLGGQVANAMQLRTQQAQIDNLNTQSNLNASGTAKNIYDVQNLMPAQLQKLQFDTGLSAIQTQQVGANLESIQASIKNLDADTALKQIQQLMGAQNFNILQASANALTRVNIDAGKAADYGLTGLSNLSSAQQGTMGRIAAWLNMVLEPMHAATQIYKAGAQ